MQTSFLGVRSRDCGTGDGYIQSIERITKLIEHCRREHVNVADLRCNWNLRDITGRSIGKRQCARPWRDACYSIRRVFSIAEEAVEAVVLAESNVDLIRRVVVMKANWLASKKVI